MKAIYQKALGWYDCNPAQLDPLPPADSAKKFVAYMGGAARVLEKARADFGAGEFRFVAEVLNHFIWFSLNRATRTPGCCWPILTSSSATP